MEYYSALKKEWSFDICCNMDRPWKLYAYWNKPDTERQMYDCIYVSYLEETNSETK